MDRVFLDANVLFSAAYRSDSGLRQLLLRPGVAFLTSVYAVEEAHRNLSTDQQRQDLERICAGMELIGEAPSERVRMPEVDLPEGDWPILLAAIQAKATHLLTGDRKDFGKYYGLKIKGVLILPPAIYARKRRKKAD